MAKNKKPKKTPKIKRPKNTPKPSTKKTSAKPSPYQTGLKHQVGPDLAVKIAGLRLKNPVLLAAGTSGTGQELAGLVDLNKLGAFVTKTLTIKPRPGNPPPRLAETSAGLLNSIGWQNPGVGKFLDEELPYLRKFSIPIIASIGGEDIAEYLAAAKALNKKVDALEINISCPNVDKGGLALGVNPEATTELTRALKKVTDLPIIIKLSPNVGDITLMARAAADGGADALALINTLKGLAIDHQTGRPKLANTFGGLSGPAIKPVALAMIWQVARTIDLPIIGMGGISQPEDALEFFWAGATAIAIGTASFWEPTTCLKIIAGLEQWLKEKNWPDLKRFRPTPRP